MAIGKGSSLASNSLKQAVQEHFLKHGIIYTFGIIITIINAIMIWNTGVYLTRADAQMEADYKIGILEGKMELLEKIYILPTPTATPTPTIVLPPSQQ